jgi:glucuronate isomerase
MYCRFDNGIHPRDNVVDVVCTLKDHIESLEDHKQLLEKVRKSHCTLQFSDCNT